MLYKSPVSVCQEKQNTTIPVIGRNVNWPQSLFRPCMLGKRNFAAWPQRVSGTTA